MIIQYDRANNAFQRLPTAAPDDFGLQDMWVHDLVMERLAEILGGPVMVLSQDYAGFSSDDRPDILALDQNGRIMVVALSGGVAREDAAIKALKYAAYCSQMKPEHIVEMYDEYVNRHDIDLDGASPREVLVDFLGGSESAFADSNRTQMVVLVANDFDEKIAAVAVWLYKNNVDLRCVKLSTYVAADDSMLIMPEIYLPTPGLETNYEALKATSNGSNGTTKLEAKVDDPFVKDLVSSLPETLKTSPFNDRDVTLQMRSGGDFRIGMFGKNRAGGYFARRWLRFYLFGPSRDEVRQIQNGATDSQSVNDKGHEVSYNVRNQDDLNLMLGILRRRFNNRGEAIEVEEGSEEAAEAGAEA